MDRDLVEQAQHGDRDAFAILARTHADRLMAIAYRILRDVGRAEDSVQQTLVIAWRELHSLRDPDRFEPWIQRLLVHASYAEARNWRSWQTNVRVLPVDGPAAPDDRLSVHNRDLIERGFRRVAARISNPVSCVNRANRFPSRYRLIASFYCRRSRIDDGRRITRRIFS